MVNLSFSLKLSLQKFFFYVLDPSLPNGTTKEEDFSAIQEYSIKCPQCQKGCQTFQALKEHIEVSHSELSSLSSSDADSLCISNVISTTPPLSNGGQFGCLHCTTSFSSKELLDKHELLHSPNAQVVSLNFFYKY